MRIAWNKGKHWSKEIRNKMSIAHKGQHYSPTTEFKKGQKVRLGAKHTQESRKKMSDSLKGRKSWNKGLKGKQSWQNIKGFKLGQGWNKGLRGRQPWHNIEGLKKGFGWNKGLPSEMQSNWKGGISFEPYSVDWTETLRRSIRERDNYICQNCSQYGNVVHHIDYNKKNCCPENLITLCNKCNLKVNYKREYWTNHFNKRRENE